MAGAGLRLAIISDIHSNLIALETLSDLLNSSDQVICLGDLTGYYTQPNQVINVLRDLSAACVLGNHDYYALHGCPPDMPPAVQWGVQYSTEHLTEENRRWLSDLPLVWSLRLVDFTGLFVHGAPWDPLHAYLYPNEPRLPELDGYNFDLIGFGQTHRVLTRTERRPVLLNPGSVGQSRDQPARACAAVFCTDSRKVELISREYDPAPVLEKARRAGAGDWICKHLV